MENPFGNEPVEIEITDVFDLHGFAPREMDKATRIYLTEARKKGFKWVRIIHGRGIGMQRDRVRKILAETDFVESFKDGDELSGGWGAQVVRLK
jgi:dsDNA-specific endonuclease/ATPase MutS2